MQTWLRTLCVPRALVCLLMLLLPPCGLLPTLVRHPIPTLVWHVATAAAATKTTTSAAAAAATTTTISAAAASASASAAKCVVNG